MKRGRHGFTGSNTMMNCGGKLQRHHGPLAGRKLARVEHDVVGERGE